MPNGMVWWKKTTTFGNLVVGSNLVGKFCLPYQSYRGENATIHFQYFIGNQLAHIWNKFLTVSECYKQFEQFYFQPVILKIIVSIATKLQWKSYEILEAVSSLLHVCCPRFIEIQTLKIMKKNELHFLNLKHRFSYLCISYVNLLTI